MSDRPHPQHAEYERALIELLKGNFAPGILESMRDYGNHWDYFDTAVKELLMTPALQGHPGESKTALLRRLAEEQGIQVQELQMPAPWRVLFGPEPATEEEITAALKELGDVGSGLPMVDPEDDMVICMFCYKQAPRETARVHQTNWVGECCWDERLRATQ